jgi:acyl-coenzyme A thioesterase PaaI-like protein
MSNDSDGEQIRAALRARMQEQGERLVIPPPVFLAMKGEFLEFDEQAKTLTTRFPILDDQLNPFGTMQGGMIAAAVDNTVGPLSLLVAPASVTRRLEMKYSRTIAPEDGHIDIVARLIDQKKRRLLIEAVVTNSLGVEVASGKSTHWIME